MHTAFIHAAQIWSNYRLIQKTFICERMIAAWRAYKRTDMSPKVCPVWTSSSGLLAEKRLRTESARVEGGTHNHRSVCIMLTIWNVEQVKDIR